MLSPLRAGMGKQPESGVSAYTAALATSLTGRVDLVVLAQADCALTTLGRARVVPTWTPDRKLAKQVSQTVRRLGIDLLHVQHEFNLYGGLRQGSLLTVMLMGMRRRGTCIVTTVHGVVDPSEITPAFIRRNFLPGTVGLVRTGFKVAYKAISASSDALIVHHPHFRAVLADSYGIPLRKIHVVTPGLPTVSQPRPRGPARQEVLILGFLTGYKLPELVVEVAESDLLPDAPFRFCVGQNPRIKDPAYAERYARLEKRVRALGSRAVWSGYIPDEQLPKTFESAAALVLPYTECVSASAVASLAQQFGTAVCYSRPLRPLFGPGPLEFELDARSLAGALRRAINGESVVQAELFTSWEASAVATESLWKGLLEANENSRSNP